MRYHLQGTQHTIRQYVITPHERNTATAQTQYAEQSIAKHCMTGRRHVEMYSCSRCVLEVAHTALERCT